MQKFRWIQRISEFWLMKNCRHRMLYRIWSLLSLESWLILGLCKTECFFSNGGDWLWDHAHIQSVARINTFLPMDLAEMEWWLIPMGCKVQMFSHRWNWLCWASWWKIIDYTRKCTISNESNKVLNFDGC